MPKMELDLSPVSHITVDAIGQPGKRVFYLQGWRESDPQPVTVIIEKIQLNSLVLGIEQILGEIAAKDSNRAVPKADYDESKMGIHPPVDPLFRTGELGLGYDEEHDLMVIYTREIIMEDEPEEKGSIVRFWCTRQQVSNLADWGKQVIQRGRPLCPQCGEPMEVEGHFCPKKNGHKKK